MAATRLEKSDPPYHQIETTLGPLSYTEEGEGIPLIALHGAPGTVRDFRYLGPLLSPNMRLIRLEFPGFGSSPIDKTRRLDGHFCADIVLAFMDAMGLEKAALVGHSFGGHVALLTALKAPERISALILLASMGLRKHKALRQTPFYGVYWLLKSPLKGLFMPQVRKGFIQSGFPANLSDDALKRTIEILAYVNLKGLSEQVRTLKCPTFVAWAQDDRLIEKEVSAEFAQALPPGPRHAFEKGGHALTKTCALALAEAICQWPILKEQS